MIYPEMTKTKAEVIQWAEKCKEAAVKSSDELMDAMKLDHTRLAWNGYRLPANDAMIRYMDKVLAWMAWEEATDENLPQLLQCIQDELLQEHLSFTGEGSQNPGHALASHGAAVARTTILQDFMGPLCFYRHQMTPKK